MVGQRARRYLEAGLTSCVGAACAKPRLDVVIRNAINEGLIPVRATWRRARRSPWPAALGDETLPHLPFPEFSFGMVVSGPEEMRKAVRMFLKYGVDTIKLNLSGDNFVPHAAGRHHLDERRGSRHGRARGQAARQARDRACPLVRIDQAGAAARHRDHLSRELHRRGDARHARGAEGPHLRRARHRHPVSP